MTIVDHSDDIYHYPFCLFWIILKRRKPLRS